VQSSLYVALSAQVSLEKRLDSIANNIANLSTVGFRADGIKFESLISPTASDSVAFASSGAHYISRQSGAFLQTGNLLDVAVRGEGWMAFESPDGIIYSRDGRLQMTEAGDLLSVSGLPVLDVGGAPIPLSPDAGPPRIAEDGMIMQNGQQIGAIGLFAIPPGAALSRYGQSAVRVEEPVEPVLDFTSNGLQQGFVEKSNVNPVLEMTRLIAVTRAFDSVSATLGESENALKEAIRILSSNR